MSFTDFNFAPSIHEALEVMGFEEATPIQQQAIPKILEHKDLIACAQTGTGKTAAFLLPILNKLALKPDRPNRINTLVIAPTRELALQIDQQVEGFGYFVGVSSLPVYGGGNSNSWDQQKKALTKGADIIIATPGRFIAHLNMGYVNLDHIQHLVLDEADRMLDMGFYDDIMTIVNKLPRKRQTLLFSATMPPKIRTLSKTILHKPDQISLAISKPADGVLQAAYLTYDNQKIPLIKYLLNGKTNYPSIIIFSSTKKMVREITQALRRTKFTVESISSDLEQKERETALLKFKSKQTQIVVATDILARGIDIKDISLVINYDVPQDAEDYVHRIGRTARAATTGVALTFINPKDQNRFKGIEDLIEMEVQKVPLPPELGEGPTYNPNARRSSHRRGHGPHKKGRGSKRKGGGGGYWKNKKKSNNKGFKKQK
ncbi:MAG: DEAD/DEAH box helicase [Bacteroidota bacterium]